MNCARCGQPVLGSRCAHCSSEPIGRSANTGTLVTWPFHQPAWAASLWMPLLGSSLWPFGLLINLGWSIEAIGQLARDASSTLPRVQHLARILKHGIVVVIAASVYFIIPLFILSQIIEFSWIEEIREIIVAIWNGLTHSDKASIVSAIWKLFFKLLANSTAPIIYLLVASPLFLVARLRYALTGQVRSFFNLTGNLAVCFRSMGEILLYLFLATITRGAITLILAAVAGTIIGIVVPIALAAANTWILAYLAANVARQMYERDGIGTRAENRRPPLNVRKEDAVPPSKDFMPPPARALNPWKASTQLAVNATPVLYCRTGPLANKTFPVSKDGYFIGRSPAVSQVIVTLPEISSKHVRIRADSSSNRVWVEDLNSTNGTYYCADSEQWQRLTGCVCLSKGGKFKLSHDGAEFEIGEE